MAAPSEPGAGEADPAGASPLPADQARRRQALLLVGGSGLALVLLLLALGLALFVGREPRHGMPTEAELRQRHQQEELTTRLGALGADADHLERLLRAWDRAEDPADRGRLGELLATELRREARRVWEEQPEVRAELEGRLGELAGAPPAPP